MRVALVHDWLVGMRGGEKCLEVFCELFPDADVYTLVYAPESISPAIRRMSIRASWVNSLPMAASYYRYLLPVFPTAIESFDFGDYDLIVSSSHCVAKGVFPHRALHLSYVHAPMRYVWDLHGAYSAGDAALLARAGLRLCRPYLQRWDVRSSNRVDCFIANSRAIAEKIERLYGRRSKVIYPPVDVDRFSVSADIAPYYLIVSALVPYKRIDVAVEAFNKLQLRLKIVGAGPLRRTLERKAEANIEFLGWVDDVKLAELYASCQALIFPGEEDFGIVPLEAQASGRPVIAFKRGGLLETVIGLDEGASPPTGIFFNEQKSESLIAAVRRYEQNRDLFDPSRIRTHAGKFARDRFRREISAHIDFCIERIAASFKTC